MLYIRKFAWCILLICCTSCYGKKTFSKETKPQILRTTLKAEVLSFDPRKGVLIPNQVVTRALFSGLVCLDQNMVAQLDLARSYTVSQDFKTYTFILRDSQWSDGSPILAKDFEETWKGALSPNFISNLSDLFYFIKNGEKALLGECSTDELGVIAKDDKTLVVELETPYPKFLELLCSPVFFPVHHSMRFAEVKNGIGIITSGAFRLKHHIFQSEIVLEKNPDFWDAQNVKLQEIHFFIITDPTTTLQMFENKEIDFICEANSLFPHDASVRFKERGLWHQVLSAGTGWLLINNQKFPFNNRNIRKALSYAIDRSSLMKNVLYLDDAPPSLGILPKMIKKERWHPWFQDNDVEEAQKLFAQGLKELNITKEEFPTIMITHAGPPGVIPAIQQMWESVLGCKVHYQAVDVPTWLHHIQNGNYQISRLAYTLIYNDPIALLDLFRSDKSKTKYSTWKCPQYDQEVAYALSSTNEIEKWKHIEKAEDIFCKEMPAIPLANMSTSYLKHPYVKQIDVNYMSSINFRKAYIE